MIPHKYIITLTNGTTQQEYKKSATNKEAAIILAQAEAIQNARGYELVSVVEEKITNINTCFEDVGVKILSKRI